MKLKFGEEIFKTYIFFLMHKNISFGTEVMTILLYCTLDIEVGVLERPSLLKVYLD